LDAGTIQRGFQAPNRGLAEGLQDPYAAVRFISQRSLRTLPGFGSPVDAQNAPTRDCRSCDLSVGERSRRRQHSLSQGWRVAAFAASDGGVQRRESECLTTRYWLSACQSSPATSVAQPARKGRARWSPGLSACRKTFSPDDEQFQQADFARSVSAWVRSLEVPVHPRVPGVATAERQPTARQRPKPAAHLKRLPWRDDARSPNVEERAEGDVCQGQPARGNRSLRGAQE
jgi:hypothetical protein